MKKYMIILLMLVTANASAVESKTIGRMSASSGTAISISAITYSTGDKAAFIYVRGKYGVRKMSVSLSKYKVKRLIKLLNESMKEID